MGSAGLPLPHSSEADAPQALPCTPLRTIPSGTQKCPETQCVPGKQHQRGAPTACAERAPGSPSRQFPGWERQKPAAEAAGRTLAGQRRSPGRQQRGAEMCTRAGGRTRVYTRVRGGGCVCAHAEAFCAGTAPLAQCWSPNSQCPGAAAGSALCYGPPAASKALARPRARPGPGGSSQPGGCGVCGWLWTRGVPAPRKRNRIPVRGC